MKKKVFKLPRKVMILGRQYKIKSGKNLVFNNQKILGLCIPDDQLILIEKDQSEKSIKETLTHECAHAFLAISGIDQKLSDSENEVYAQLLTAFVEDMEKARK